MRAMNRHLERLIEYGAAATVGAVGTLLLVLWWTGGSR